MALPSITASTGNWTDEIAEEAEKEMKAQIDIYDPGTETPYDPVTDTGGTTTPVVLARTKARIVRVRRPQAASTTDEALSKHPVRFQIPRSEATNFFIRKGLRIRVTDGGEDPSLEYLDYIITVGINGSAMAVRTIETLAEMSPTFAVANPGLTPSDLLFPGDQIQPEEPTEGTPPFDPPVS